MEPPGNPRALPGPLHASGEAIVPEDFQISVRNVGSWYRRVKRSAPLPNGEAETPAPVPKEGPRPPQSTGSDILGWTAPQVPAHGRAAIFLRARRHAQTQESNE